MHCMEEYGMEMYSDFLYAKPSFWEGMARAMDIGGTMNEYNTSLTGWDADTAALRLDWMAVGQDIYDAVQGYEVEDSDELPLSG